MNRPQVQISSFFGQNVEDGIQPVAGGRINKKGRRLVHDLVGTVQHGVAQL